MRFGRVRKESPASGSPPRESHPLIPLALALCAAGCRPGPPATAGAPVDLAAAPSGARRGVPVSVRLTDVAAAAGVRFQHEYGSQHPLPIVETMGSGCAFLDYDNDGRLDL